MNDWLDYKGSGSSRYYANDILIHGQVTGADNVRKIASTRSSVENAYSELIKLDRDITALGNQLRYPKISNTTNSAKSAALDSKYRNIRATAMTKYNQWKTKIKSFKSLLNEYKQYNPSDVKMKDYEAYAKNDTYPLELSLNAYQALFETKQ